MEIYQRNIIKLFEQVQDYFTPKVIGKVDDVYIKLAKVKGDKVPWHVHENEDEMFFIFRGVLTMEIENTVSFELTENEFYIVKKGTKHRVHSSDECWLILIENKSTKHTGNVASEITRSIEEQLCN